MPKYINGYEIVERHQGGMAVVYKGINPKGFTRAFKMIRPDKAANNPALCQKFLKGIKILQQLAHPGIVKALDAFTYKDDETGGLYTVLEMDWLDGMNLEELVKTEFPQGMRPDDVRSLSIDVCKAFYYAHQKKVLHLDIKPANLILTKSGYIKIIDFGIARIMGENAGIVDGGETISTATETGETSFRGTLAYASPEQFNGAKVTERSDIYSFGCTLNYLLTGTTDPRARVQDSHFASIIKKCREHNPDDRYASFEELRKAIEGTAEKECIQCHKSISADARFCPYCGSPQNKKAHPEPELKTKACPKCGAEMESSVAFCTTCGYKFGDSVERKKGIWKCTSCGKTLPAEFNDDRNNYCCYCGQKSMKFISE